ncbi:hypothetical protein BLOT_001562 [Blomia tropicalis]|nr:hypothetical protein BLOT_001562 [Blomia tropicalis]
MTAIDRLTQITYHLLTKQTDHPFSIPIRDSFIEFLSPFVCLSLLANQKLLEYRLYLFGHFDPPGNFSWKA